MRSEERIAKLRGTHPPDLSPHLSDDQLMEAYVLTGEDPHLIACRKCKARFDDLVRALEQVREDAVREADSVFTSEQLHEQRDRIMRRLERHGHPAEVVMFPQRASESGRGPARPRPGAALGCCRSGGRPRGRPVPWFRDGSPPLRGNR